MSLDRICFRGGISPSLALCGDSGEGKTGGKKKKEESRPSSEFSFLKGEEGI